MKKGKEVFWLPLRAEGNIIYDAQNDEIFIVNEDPQYIVEFIDRFTTKFCNNLLNAYPANS